MQRAMLSFLALAFVATTAGGSEPPPSYRVAQLKGKLVRLGEGSRERLHQGTTAAGGDRLKTGWFSRAELAVDEAKARFTVGPSTTVLLTSNEPGVLLEVERGRLRALFDSLAGRPDAERLVTTPSAVLAVRGTSYGVAVDRHGATLVVVFAGTVQVRERSGLGEPVMVHAQEMVLVQQGRPVANPRPHHVDAAAWDQGSVPKGWNRGPGPGAGPPTDQGPVPGRGPSSPTGSGRHGG